jgi:putative redox protein
MECTVRWVGKNAGMSFIGESGSGHAVVMDGAPEAGGRNLGPRPMEMLLMGTGGCSAFDVVMILQKARQNVSDCQVRLDATRAQTDPKVFTKIHFHFLVSGTHLSRASVERAVKLSHEKYCSASIMLAQVAEITHSFEIIDNSLAPEAIAE